jgi:fatty acid desaturase
MTDANNANDLAPVKSLLSGKESHVRQASRWLPLTFGAVILCWFAYLVMFPVLWLKYGNGCLILVPTVGVYLCTWLGYYWHELWHNYFPGLNNQLCSDLVAYLLLADPQTYRLVHASHHKYLHTADDLEMHCVDWKRSLFARRLQFVGELLFGNIAWEFNHRICLLRDRRANPLASLRAVLIHLLYLASIMLAANWVLPGAWEPAIASFWLTLWIGSWSTRQNQWIEHLGIQSELPQAESALLTRNMSSETFAGWLFNLMNHHDAETHLFHHTDPKLNSRNVEGLELPEMAVTITMSQYASIVLQHARGLFTAPEADSVGLSVFAR